MKTTNVSISRCRLLGVARQTNLTLRSLLSLMLCLGLTAGMFGMLGCASTSTRESTGEFIDDSAITAKVKAKFAKDPVVSAMQVKVETFKGIVQLSGFVDTKGQADRAKQLAREVEGVKEVKSDILVKPAN